MPKFFIYDQFDPEANAMLQALYSRSPESVEAHAQKVLDKGSKKFMESYYVGYGHASIGDCGTTTMFIEGVSILAAKAIQDNPLYSGQETSTRYIDFSTQEILDPLDSPESRQIQENWRRFYIDAMEPLEAALRDRYPLQEGESEKVWGKAIKARGFDILRGFLPAGVATQLSWSTNLRQAHDKIILLLQHPLAEVRDIAAELLRMVKERYPSSFGHRDQAERDQYLERFAGEIHYLTPPDAPPKAGKFDYGCDIDNRLLEQQAVELIAERPKYTNLPRHLSRYGRYRCRFLMDYGSYRDIQRHRAGLCPIPLLTDRLGFHTWYLEQLPAELCEQAAELLSDQRKAIAGLAAAGATDAELQYYQPLGANVYCELTYDLPEMVYVTELRSGSTVHPTLRRIAHQMHAALKAEHPKLALHADLSIDPWDIRRGKQDIEKREAS